MKPNPGLASRWPSTWCALTEGEEVGFQARTLDEGAQVTAHVAGPTWASFCCDPSSAFSAVSTVFPEDHSCMGTAQFKLVVVLQPHGNALSFPSAGMELQITGLHQGKKNSTTKSPG